MHLAVKAFAPAPVPFPLLHVDTGHNYPEVIDFRDRARRAPGLRLDVAHVQDWIDDGRLVERPDGTRNPLQTLPLLDTIAEHRFDAVFGGGRRDEERARAKERIISPARRVRPLGPAQPAPGAVEPLQRPARARRARPGVPDLQLDRAGRLALHPAREGIELPSIYYAHEREVFRRDGMWLAEGPWGGPRGAEVLRAQDRALPHRRRRLVHRRRRVRRRRRSTSHRRGHRVAAHRARRDPGRRPALRGRHGRPQAGGLLLMVNELAAICLRFADGGLGRRRQVHPGRTAALRHQVGARRPDRGRAPRLGRQGTATPDLSLLVDGLRAEREQGITIDVAYRYFATPEARVRARRHPRPRPVHPQHRHRRVHRGARGAAGRRPQRRGRADPPARRGARAAARPAARAGHQQDRPGRLRRGGAHRDRQGLRRARHVARLPDDAVVTIPVSALLGDNVVERSAHTPWYDGPDAAGAPGVRAGRRARGRRAVPDARCST